MEALWGGCFSSQSTPLNPPLLYNCLYSICSKIQWGKVESRCKLQYKTCHHNITYTCKHDASNLLFHTFTSIIFFIIIGIQHKSIDCSKLVVNCYIIIRFILVVLNHPNNPYVCKAKNMIRFANMHVV